MGSSHFHLPSNMKPLCPCKVPLEATWEVWITTRVHNNRPEWEVGPRGDKISAHPPPPAFQVKRKNESFTPLLAGGVSAESRGGRTVGSELSHRDPKATFMKSASVSTCKH